MTDFDDLVAQASNLCDQMDEVNRNGRVNVRVWDVQSGEPVGGYLTWDAIGRINDLEDRLCALGACGGCRWCR